MYTHLIFGSFCELNELSFNLKWIKKREREKETVKKNCLRYCQAKGLFVDNAASQPTDHKGDLDLI